MTKPHGIVFHFSHAKPAQRALLSRWFAQDHIKEWLHGVGLLSHVKRVLIDPEATNVRAIHVYKKVGFKIVGEFIASWHTVPHYQMELQMQTLLDSKRQEFST